MSVASVSGATRRRASFGNRKDAQREEEPRLVGDCEEQRRFWREVSRVARRTALTMVARSRFPRHVVDDVVQETLIAAFQILPVWDRSRPLKTWIITVARNKTIDLMREAKLHRRRPLDDLHNVAAPSAATAAECRMDLTRLMARLPPRSREIVMALALQGESAEEVGSRLALSNGAVRVALHRALRLMGDESPAKRNRGFSLEN